MSNVRTFIAVPVEGVIADSVAQFVNEMRKVKAPVKWVETGNLHVTLKFLGDLPRSRIPTLVEAVKEAVKDEPKFEMSLCGAGAFPTPSRPRVLWVGIADGSEALGRLAKAVDRATVEAGFAPADKAFKPHLTIGRVRGRGHSAGSGLTRIISDNSQIQLGAANIEAIHVYSSDLTPSGPIYTSLAKIPLK